MLYRMDSEYHNSQYIFIDWERLDACEKPSDTDARGRRCGKRAKMSKKIMKNVAESKAGREAKASALQKSSMNRKFTAENIGQYSTAKTQKGKEKAVERLKNNQRRSQEQRYVFSDPSAMKSKNRKNAQLAKQGKKGVYYGDPNPGDVYPESRKKRRIA